eukprot:scaffold7366_cov254-Pinguiococcus_pyrenoidosus.AAC.7
MYHVKEVQAANQETVLPLEWIQPNFITFAQSLFLRLRRRRRRGELAVQLDEASDRHEDVYREEIPVHRRDHHGVARPDHAGGRHGHLLRSGDLLHRPLQVRDVRKTNGPLEGRRPKENCVVVTRSVPVYEAWSL